jgi:hypothetical protein
MNDKGRLAVGVAALAALFALYFALKRPTERPYDADGTGSEPPPSPVSRPPPPASRDASASATADATAAHARLSPDERRELTKKIHAALWAESGEAAPDPNAPARLPVKVPALSPAYIQERMREDFKPMAAKCYEELLARAPDAGGTAKLAFTIVADDELGAIVEDVSLGEGTTLTDTSFATCLTESMTTVRFAAPKTSGKTTVHYPFLFSPGDEPPEGPK